MTNEFGRRTILAAPALLAFASGTAACAQTSGTSQRARSNTLVAYFSRSGNTRVIAGTLQRALEADLFEIEPLRPYPEDYEQTVEQARQERDRGYEPPLKARAPGVAAYDTVFLGFPIWGETAPPVIRSFLQTHDLAGKTLRPFITHGGYGPGNSLTVLQKHVPTARIENRSRWKPTKNGGHSSRSTDGSGDCNEAHARSRLLNPPEHSCDCPNADR